MSRPKVKLSVREETFCHDIVAKGHSVEEAYRANWKVDKQIDAKVRYQAKLMRKKDNIAQFITYLIDERTNNKMVDEAFVIEHLKDTALTKKDTTVGLRALELLGKTLGMFADRKIIEDKTSDAANAAKLFELAAKLANGEDIGEDIKILKGETDVKEIEFTVIE